MSIPISIIACFALLYFGGLTLNQMTFGGLALGVGMMVDNAIVVLENIVRKREETRRLAAKRRRRWARREVAGAMLASTLTTCVVFLPLVFMQSISGALFQSLALVVIFCQACSLVVGFTVVPVLAARMLRKHGRPRARRRGCTPAGAARADRPAGALVRPAPAPGAGPPPAHVRRDRPCWWLASLLLWPLIPVELAPHTDADEIDVELEMAQGTNMAVVRAYVDEIEQKVRAGAAARPGRLISTEIRGGDAEVELRLVPADRRSMTGAEIADRLRRAVDGQIPGGEIDVNAQPGLWILRRIFSSGQGDDAVEVELRGWDIERIGPDRRRDAPAHGAGARPDRRARQPPGGAARGAAAPRSRAHRRAGAVGARRRPRHPGQRGRHRGRARDHNRRGLVSLRHHAAEGRELDVGEDVADVVARTDDQRAVLAAVRALPPRQRDCITLRYFEDLSIEAIAATLGRVAQLGQDPHPTGHGTPERRVRDPGDMSDAPPTVEARLVDAFAAARSTIVEHPDLFARVTRSIADMQARRRFRRRLAAGIGAFVLANAALALALSDRQQGSITMDWWVIELITNIVLVAIAVALGPFIKRFGRSYAADVFRDNPQHGEELPRPDRRGVLPDLHGVHLLHGDVRRARRLVGDRRATSNATSWPASAGSC